MAEKKTDFAWERLATPPRDVPRSVRARVRLAELNALAPNFSGFLGFFAVISSTVLIGFGTMWFNLAEEEDYPQAGIPLVAAGLAGFVWLLATIYRRGSRRIQVLQNGRLNNGTITLVWRNVKYYSYEALIGLWRKFFEQIDTARETNPQAGAMSLRYLRMEFSRVPCKVRVLAVDGKEREINMRLDLRRHLLESDTSPRIRVLCDPDRVNDGIAASQLYPWLTLAPDGHWQTATSAGFAVFLTTFFRAALPVIGTYISAALGITLFGDPLLKNLQVKGSPSLLALMTVVLTVTHVVGAVFLFRAMLDFLSQFAALIRSGPEGLPLRIFTSVFRCFLWGFIGLWFGAPMIVLAYLTGWLSLILAAAHLMLANRQLRPWLFIEYGSTALALVLFVVSFSTDRFFPLGLFVVVLQSLLLAILDLSMREKWLSPRVATASG